MIYLVLDCELVEKWQPQIPNRKKVLAKWRVVLLRFHYQRVTLVVEENWLSYWQLLLRHVDQIFKEADSEDMIIYTRSANSRFARSKVLQAIIFLSDRSREKTFRSTDR